jgi:hypothetical protein
MTNREKAYELITKDITDQLMEFQQLAIVDAIELASKPEWISVEDRLPKIGLNVLVYFPDPYSIYRMSIAFVVDSAHYDRVVWSINASPTYWINLPSPPKG